MNRISSNKTVGVVTIGRNEGQRLKNCIASLLQYDIPIVYVDSGSTDDSVAYCNEHQVAVLELDMGLPFTAARARNEGFNYLISMHPNLNYVQFIDGDCQLNSDWLQTSMAFLDSNKNYAAACGRRREIYPSASVYNMLCDIEWDSSPGDSVSCGGDVLIRVESFNQVGGYRSDLIAGEEPEMCFRMKEKGWKIRRLDCEMTLHDANMKTFSQWWKRAQRAGYAYTESAWLHRDSSTHYNVRPVLRIAFWGLLFPISVLMGFSLSSYLFLLILLYPIQYYRLLQNGPRSTQINRQWAKYIVIGKFAEITGLFRCLTDILLARKTVIIEYK